MNPEELEEIKALFMDFMDKDIPVQIVVPWVEGNLLYLEQKAKGFKTVQEFIDFMKEGYESFNNNGGSYESIVSRMILERSINHVEAIKDAVTIEVLAEELHRLNENIHKSRMFYHEKLFENPNLKFKDMVKMLFVG